VDGEGDTIGVTEEGGGVVVDELCWRDNRSCIVKMVF